MSKSIYFAVIAHNTSRFAYRLGAEISHHAKTTGLCQHVFLISFRQSCHRLLLPLIEQDPNAFDASCLSIQMPWHNKEKPENRTKYATALIEASEALEIGLAHNYLSFTFHADLRKMLTDLPAVCSVLFVVVDVRSAVEVAFIKTKCLATKCVFLRVAASNQSRKEFACAELNSSVLETYAENTDAFQFDMNLTGSEIEDVLPRVFSLIDGLVPKKDTTLELD